MRFLALFAFPFLLIAQQRPFSTQQQSNGTTSRPADTDNDEQNAERELRIGVALTSQGQFKAAIPHLKLADGVVTETFAVEFNLGLCYLGTRQYKQAVHVLSGLHGNTQQTAQTKNLLAQAYICDHQPEKGFRALQEAAALTPRDEKLYAFVSDACLDEGFYQVGIDITEIGLRNLPNSARLFLQRGLLRSRLEEIALAKQDFEQASRLAPHTDIGYIASVHEALSSGRIDDAIRQSREAIAQGHAHYMLLTMLGEALLRQGASAATPAQLTEAQNALEQAVAKQPGYASAQIALGKLLLIENKTTEAIAHLELARRLEPSNSAVYSNLASAYRASGDTEKLQEVLAMLRELNQQQVSHISSAGDGHNGVATGPAPHL